MELLARAYFLVFGLLTIAFGVYGYVKAKSRPSLIAGAASGVLLVGSAALIGLTSGREGLAPALILSLLLGGRFGASYAKTKAMMPAGTMAGLSALGLVIGLVTLFGR